MEGCRWDSRDSGLWKPARWAGQTHAGGPLSTVGGGWRHLPSRLPSPGLCGFLRFHLPGQPGPPGSPIQVLLPGRRPLSSPCSHTPHPLSVPAARSSACTSPTAAWRTSSCPGAMTVRPQGVGSEAGGAPEGGEAQLWEPRHDTVSPAEYMYQMMKFNKFSLPQEVGGGEGPSGRPALPTPLCPPPAPPPGARWAWLLSALGLLHHPVPLLLPLAHWRRLPAAVQ